MDEVMALRIMGHFWPKLVGLLVATVFLLAPSYSSAIIMRVANERAEQITAVLKEAVESSFADSQQRRSQHKTR